MRGSELLEKMELIEPCYIEAAEAKPLRKKHRIIKWLAAAACICIVVAAFPLFMQEPESPQENSNPHDVAPHIIIDDKMFIISSYLSVSEEIPEGFSKAGIADTSGGMENCPYYTNPDIQEWIYVYHEVRTNGKTDSTGTLISTEPHNAYVRYVDERLRGKELICHEGKYYISLWSAKSYGENPDVTEEYYDKVESLYGPRFKAPAPEGFELLGTAEFTGYDTVPEGKLSSNEGALKIHQSHDEPEVLLAETTWSTAPDSDGKTLHHGFDVYILYDCPFE